MVLGAISLAVTIVIGLWTAKIQREQVELQRRLLEMEQTRDRESRKAVLSAGITKELGSRRMKDILRIENSGASEARVEAITVDGVSIYDHSAFLHSGEPISFIGPKSHVDFLLVLSMGQQPPSYIEISWTDATGEPGKYRSSLTL